MGYRDACNDCHSRKVKCEQGPTGGACLNCQNAGKECVYGSTRKMGRPKQARRRGTDPTGRIKRSSSTPSDEAFAPPPVPSATPGMSPVRHYSDDIVFGSRNASMTNGGPLVESTESQTTATVEAPTSQAETATDTRTTPDHASYTNPPLYSNYTFGSTFPSENCWPELIDTDQTHPLDMDSAMLLEQLIQQPPPPPPPMDMDSLQHSPCLEPESQVGPSNLAYECFSQEYSFAPPATVSDPAFNLVLPSHAAPSAPMFPTSPPTPKADSVERLALIQFEMGRVRESVNPNHPVDPQVFASTSELCAIIRTMVRSGPNGMSRKDSGVSMASSASGGLELGGSSDSRILMLLLTLTAVLETLDDTVSALSAVVQTSQTHAFNYGLFASGESELDTALALNVLGFYLHCFEVHLKMMEEQGMLDSTTHMLFPRVAGKVASLQHKLSKGSDHLVADGENLAFRPAT